MLEIIQLILMYLGAAIALIFVIGLWVVGLFMINQETNALFKHRRNDRFADKLFNKIEEFRRDFA